MPVRPALTFLLVAIVAGCNAEPLSPSEPAVHLAPIINGTPEPDRRAVGALVLAESRYDRAAPPEPDYIVGALCTATLIAPHWVLTAAHCLDDFRIESLRFITAPDIGAIATGAVPMPNTARPIIQAVVHPEYQRGGARARMHADIALLRLASPITNVTPMPLATNIPDLPGDAVIVGFGIYDSDDNAGERRAARTAIDAATDTVVKSVPGANGEYGNICSGDSGGALLIKVNGTDALLGVHSMGRCVDDDCTLPRPSRCSSGGIHIRTDAFRGWIDDTLSRTTQDCRVDPTLCPCDAACSWTNGACSPVDCRFETCAEGLACAENCAGAADVDACHGACEKRVVTAGLDILEVLYVCERLECANTEGEAREGCLEARCGPLLEACSDHTEMPAGSSCQRTMRCMDGCDESDWNCNQRCIDGAHPRARELWWALGNCSAAACAGMTGDVLQGCREVNCAESLALCIDTSRPQCNIVGGDCGIGFACRMDDDDVARCVPSLDIPLHGACAFDIGDAWAQCADGAYCAYAGQKDWESGRITDDMVCAAYCRVDSDCGPHAFCDPFYNSSYGGCVEGVTGPWTGDPAPPVCDGPGLPPCNPVVPVEPEPEPETPAVTTPKRDGCAGGGPTSTAWVVAVVGMLGMARRVRRRWVRHAM